MMTFSVITPLINNLEQYILGKLGFLTESLLLTVKLLSFADSPAFRISISLTITARRQS